MRSQLTLRPASRFPLLLVVSMLALPQLLSAETQTFYLSGEGFDNSVTFASAAKFELFDGSTDDIEGSFDFDTDDPVELSGQIQVDLTTLRTGIDQRDESMRENNLETDRYQYAVFELTGVKGLSDPMEAENGYDCTVIGQFTLHGVTKYMEIPAGVVMSVPDADGAANLKNLQIRAEFSIQLDDYNIPRPTALFLQVAETVDIKVEFTATTTPPEEDQ
jgi:polyisoprenoid-binding protein YceI